LYKPTSDEYKYRSYIMDRLFFVPPLSLTVYRGNNNKLMVHMYIDKNTTIFLIVRLLLIRYYMFRPSMLAIFRLYMKHLTIGYIYT